MRRTSLAEWLTWQEQLHPQTIELGLARAGAVLQRLQLTPPPLVLTVAGTNGKGSSVAMLTAIGRAAGYRVGCYTSPHLSRYSERLTVNGAELAESDWIAAFEAVEAARQGVSLTYFEFGTLAAFWLLVQQQVEWAVLEVGLGGRLDAVNLWDADAVLITPIALDHTAWLGESREQIAYEKAGVMRQGRPAVVNDPDPPPTLLRQGVPIQLLGRDYRYQLEADGANWLFQPRDQPPLRLPRPNLYGDYQVGNSAGVVALLQQLPSRWRVEVSAIVTGLQLVALAGRFQRSPPEGERRAEVILDVAHNPHAAAQLARTLAATPVAGRRWALLAMLADKDYRAVIEPLQGTFQQWWVADLSGSRALSGAVLQQRLTELGASVRYTPELMSAWQQILAESQVGDQIVVFGSFYTVAWVLGTLHG